MNVPEYFVLFSGEGEFSVEVKFKGEGFVQPRRATAQEVASIVDARTGTFHAALTFDEHLFQMALLHKSEGRRDYPSPRRSYAMAPTGTVLGRPSCVKRLSRATRTCNSTT